MKKYAQIKKGYVHYILECEELPPFHPRIKFVEITNVSPQPKEGWKYDEETNSFTENIFTKIYSDKEKINKIIDALKYLKTNGLDIGPDGEDLIDL